LEQQAGLLEAAVMAYEHALVQEYADSVDPLAKLWRDEGDHEKAIAIWQSALVEFPVHADRLRWWQGLTNSLRATDHWEAGFIAVRRALQEFPEDARLYVEKGAIVYGFSADSTAAIEAINTAIDLDDTIAAAYSTAASILAAERMYEDAYDWYTEAIIRNPQMPSWYVARGHMARATGDLPKALDAFLVAIDRFPNFSPGYFGIAKVYQQLGDKEEAATAVERALQVTDSKDVQDFLQAAEIYEWSGDLDEAIIANQSALALDPDNSQATQALQRLQNN
jgi:tetratricopeptide (TPR) repeat protein